MPLYQPRIGKYFSKHRRAMLVLRVLCTTLIGAIICAPLTTMASPPANTTPGNSASDTVFFPFLAMQSGADAADFEMSTSVTDPLILRATRHDGKIVDYFGPKDEDGVAIALDHVTIVDPDDDSLIAIDFEDGKPSAVTTDDGTVFELVWLSETDVSIKVITSDGEQEASLVVDLTDPTGENSVTDPATLHSAAAGDLCTADMAEKSYPASGALTTRTAPASLTRIGNAGASAMGPLADSTVTLNISKCNQPFDPRSVKIRYKGWSLVPYTDYAAYRVETGVYRTRVPTYDRTTEIADICHTAATGLGHACTALSILPKGSSIRICTALSVLTGPGAPKALAACGVAFSALEIYCKTLGYSPTLGAKSIADLLCAIVEEFEKGPDEIALTPHALDLSVGQRIFGAEQSFRAEGPFSELSLALPGTTAIENFMTEPFNPAPGASYTAYVTVFPCLADLSESLTVTLSVVGTDGYTSSRTVNISSQTTLSLVVPGAEQNVRDIISVEVEGAGTKTISIVF